MEQAVLKNSQLFYEWFGLDIAKRNFDTNVTVYLQNDQPVSLTNIEEDIIIVRAPLGSGKTTALIQWLNNSSSDTSAVIISCRKTFAAEIQKSLCSSGNTKFNLYTDISERQIIDSHVIIQLESIYRLNRNYDVLVLDEFMSILNQFYSKTMTKLRTTDKTLLRLLDKCKYVIAMDATINSNVISLFSEIKRSIPIAVINNTFICPEYVDRKATFCASFFNCGGFLETLYRYLTANKKICIFCNTVTGVEHVRNLIYTKFQKKKILTVTGRQGPWTSMNNWDKYDVVIYNTVISIGVNYIYGHFHVMFVYIQLHRNSVDMVSIFQSIGRIQILLNKKIYVYMNPSLIKNKDPISPMFMPARSSVDEVNIIKTSNIDFVEKCKQKYSSTSFFKDFFKSRYLLQRITLNSLSDSFLLLCMLFENNGITVSLLLQTSPNTDDAYTFFKEVVQNSYFLPRLKSEMNHSVMEEFKTIMSNKELLFDGMFYCHNDLKMHAEFLKNINKLSALFKNTDKVTMYLDKLSSCKFRYNFVNVLMSNYIKSDTDVNEVITFLEHLSSHKIYNDLSCTTYNILTAESNIHDPEMFIELSNVTRLIVTGLKLKSCTDTQTDIMPEDMILTVSKYSNRILHILQLMFTTHMQHFQRYNHASMKIYSKLKGLHINMKITELQFSEMLLKNFFRSAFNMWLLRGKPRYVPTIPFRNLRKQDIENLLDEWNVGREEYTSYRSLRKILTEAMKKRGASSVYKLVGDNIVPHLKC